MLKSKRLKNQPTVVEVSPSELVHLPSCGICLTTAVLSKALTPSYQGTRSYNESLHFQPTWSRSSDISIQMTRLPNVTINRCAPEVRMSSHAPSLVQDDSLSRRAIASLSLDKVSTPYKPIVISRVGSCPTVDAKCEVGPVLLRGFLPPRDVWFPGLCLGLEVAV